MPYYAIKVGRNPGVYTSWPEAQQQVFQFSGAKFKKFNTMQDALSFVGETPSDARQNSNPTYPQRPVERVEPARDQIASVQQTPNFEMQYSSEFLPATRYANAPLPLVCYCDGACHGNGARNNGGAGAGVYWGDCESISEPLAFPHTNNRAELLAIILAIESIPPDSPNTQEVIIYTDSQYSISCVTKWIPKWKSRDWITAAGAPVKNKPMILYIDALISYHTIVEKKKITLIHVKGHSGTVGNEQADRLASNAATISRNRLPPRDRDFTYLAQNLESRIINFQRINGGQKRQYVLV